MREKMEEKNNNEVVRHSTVHQFQIIYYIKVCNKCSLSLILKWVEPTVIWKKIYICTNI